MPRGLLIGNHDRFKQDLEDSSPLAGCELACATNDVVLINRLE